MCQLCLEADGVRGAARRQVGQRDAGRVADLPPPDRRGLAAVEGDHAKIGQCCDQFEKIVRFGLANIAVAAGASRGRSEEHTSELQSIMRNSYAVLCLKKKNNKSQR